MDHLSLEICSGIVDYLKLLISKSSDEDSLSRYASISRVWQAAVEYRTLSELKIAIPDDFQIFSALFHGTNVRRRHFLKELTVEFVLPNERTAICCRAGRSWNKQADSQSISRSMIELFSIISEISSRAGYGTRPITLVLGDTSRHSETDPEFRERRSRRHCNEEGHTVNDMDLARIQAPVYELLDAESIPELRHVANLIFFPRSDLDRLHPSWIPKLTNKLSSLEDLQLNLRDEYEWGQRIRAQKRSALAESILSASLLNLKNFILRIYHYPMPNEDAPVHVLSKTESNDPYKQILIHLSQRSALTTLCLTGPLVIRPDFFAALQHDCFVGLTYFHLDFAAETADGGWFFSRDAEAFEKARGDEQFEEYFRESDDDDEEEEEEEEEAEDDTDSPNESEAESEEEAEEKDEYGPELGCYSATNNARRYRTNSFRTVPEPDAINMLLQQAAHAAKRMKSLRKFVIQERSHWIEGQDIGVSFPFVSRVFCLWYFTSGTPFATIYTYPKVPGDAEFLSQDRIYWRVGNWRPSNETRNAWIMGRGDVKVQFLREDGWDLDKGRNKPVYIGEM